MTSEAWQPVGPLSPRGTVSDPSDGLRGSADVHKHAETIPSLSRCFLSLAEGGESQIGMHEDDGRRPRGRTGFSLLSQVRGGGWGGGLPGFHSPRKYAHLRTLLPAHWCRRCGNWPKKLKIDHLSPNGLCVLERGCSVCVCVCCPVLLFQMRSCHDWWDSSGFKPSRVFF